MRRLLAFGLLTGGLLHAADDDTFLLKGATVAAEVIGPEKGEKLVIQKMRRRKNFRKKTGERHIFTRVKIGKISV